MIKKIALSLTALACAFILWTKFDSSSDEDSDHHHGHGHHHHHHDHDHDHEQELVEIDDAKAKDHGIAIKTTGPGTINTSFTTRGKVILNPDKVAHVLPKVSGVVREVRKTRGDNVRAGETVAVIESKEIAHAKADYLAALEREKLAAAAFEREERLYDKKISSEEDYLKSQFGLDEAKIEHMLSRQKLFALGLDGTDINEIATQNDEDFRFYEVRSPIKGTIIDRTIVQGEYLEETTPIYEIADLSKILVEIGIYPKDIDKVHAGQIAEVECTSNALCTKGNIIYVSPLIDEDTITAKAFAEIDNKDKNWKSGTFVKVKINTDSKTFPIVVPKESIQYIEGEPFIFVQTTEGFLKKNVGIGKTDDQNAEITEGLESGEPYAASNSFLLKADLGKNSVEHDHD